MTILVERERERQRQRETERDRERERQRERQRQTGRQTECTDNRNVFFPDAASQPSVTSNNHTGNLTVREGDHVTVTCAARGRPTPSLDLYNDNEGGPPLKSAVGGEMVLGDTASSLNYFIYSAMCRHTATYRCTARNDVNSGDRKENGVELSVLCEYKLSISRTVGVCRILPFEKQTTTATKTETKNDLFHFFFNAQHEDRHQKQIISMTFMTIMIITLLIHFHKINNNSAT